MNVSTRCASITMALLFVASAIWPARSMAAGPGGLAAGFEDDDDAPVLIVVADFNRDGIADMAKVTQPDGDASGPRSLTILLGRGDGTYKQVESRPVLGGDPRTIVVGDFNADGIPDVIVGDGDGTLTELLGDGKGNLVTAGSIAHLSSVVSIAVGDFNHDGTLDLAVSDAQANTVSILLGSGNGAFRPTWTFHLPMQGKVYHLAAADFNGDGVVDLAVTNDDEKTFEVMLGNGNGTFTYAPELSHVLDPNEHCTT